MNGKFWVIEGLDGCGKSTQIDLLKEYLDEKGAKYRYIHFPMLNKGVYGELIAEFLRGEFGSVGEVHPKLVALLFANDRKEHIETIREWMAEGYYVLADRYVYSNIAFQCAKLEQPAEKKKLKEWILDFEFNTNSLPKPDRIFFLNMPFDFIKKSLSQTREGEDRGYLNGKEDIHEKSLELQQNVYREYQNLVKEQPSLFCIDCYDKENAFLSKEEIHQLIVKQIEEQVY